MRRRRPLVIVTARSTSSASAPSPSQNGRYEPMNGTNTSSSEIGAKLSSTEVSTCTPRNAIASSETLRCSVSITKRGQPGVLTRRTSSTPSTTAPVSSSSATAPVERVRYQ